MDDSGSDRARKIQRAFIGLWIFGAAYAGIAQLLFQETGARYSVWGYTPGWQREIGFWNIGLIAILVPIWRRGTQDIRGAAVRALVLLSALFGTNHAVALFRDGRLDLSLYSHLGGMAENYLAVGLGLAVLFLTSHA